jgi:hypothetical protein
MYSKSLPPRGFSKPLCFQSKCGRIVSEFTLFSLSIFSDSLFVERIDLIFSGCKISGVNGTVFVYYKDFFFPI